MRLFLAFVLPPLAVLMCGRPLAALANVFLTLLYFPGMLHAVFVVLEFNADRRNRNLIESVVRKDKP